MKTIQDGHNENENSPDKAERLAVNYLSYKSRTEREVYDKLLSCGEFDEAVISQTISFLKGLGYIDDKKYAEHFVRSKASNKLDGPQKIKQMLMMRGISSKMADNALSSLFSSDGYDEFDEVQNAVKLIEKKLRGKKPDAVKKKSIFDFLARKGYSYQVIFEAFKRTANEIETDWE